ncbi:MAG: hypothetical protein JSU81_03405 [Candidatus Coatesbacteria bacterium]|nr:MAG: hypothetical protein JSU81_03405 [Candidatus Coatesbacteria bacterium]
MTSDRSRSSLSGREFFRLASYVAVALAASAAYGLVDVASAYGRMALAGAYVAALWFNVSFFLRAPYALQRTAPTTTEEGKQKLLDVAVVFGSWPLAFFAAAAVGGLAFYYRAQEPVGASAFIIEHYAAVAAGVASAYFLGYVLAVGRYRPATARRYHFGGARTKDLRPVWRPALWVLLGVLPAALATACFSGGNDVPMAATFFMWLPPFYLALVARRPLAPEEAAERKFSAVAFFMGGVFSAVVVPFGVIYAVRVLWYIGGPF